MIESWNVCAEPNCGDGGMCLCLCLCKPPSVYVCVCVCERVCVFGISVILP